MGLAALLGAIVLCFALEVSPQDPEHCADSSRPRRPEPAHRPAMPAAFDAAREPPLREAELVLGLVVNGEARAYPLDQLWGREGHVLNDTLGGLPVAPSW